jgi:hypothetical protein
LAAGRSRCFPRRAKMLGRARIKGRITCQT